MPQKKFVILAIAVLSLLAADHFYYKPMKADELRGAEEQRTRCLSMLAKIRKESGDAAREQLDGRLAGCSFGSPLG